MAHNRVIKPAFFLDWHVSQLKPLARLFYIGLWTQADREGRLRDRPDELKAAILPYDDVDAEAMMAELATPKIGTKRGFICRYEVAAERFVEIQGFADKGHPHKREPPSVLPPPPLASSPVKETRKAPAAAPNQKKQRSDDLDAAARARMRATWNKPNGNGKQGSPAQS